jgi:hypothetical protein
VYGAPRAFSALHMETALSPTEALPPDPPAQESAVAMAPSMFVPVSEADEMPGAPVPRESAALVRSHRPRNAGEQGQPSEEQPPRELPEHLQQLRFSLSLCVAIPRFTLRHLQDLTAGVILVTEHASSRDLAISAAGERLLQVELEAVELQLAARVKRLL